MALVSLQRVSVLFVRRQYIPLEKPNNVMDYSSHSVQSLIQNRRVRGGMAVAQSLISSVQFSGF